MADQLRAGLVGCGSVSQRGILPHLSQADAREKVRLVAVVDAVAERAQATSKAFDVPAHFTGVEEMLAQVDLDLVIVATPIPFHFSNALAAIAAGKHVYVQKTMTSTLVEADELLAARDRAGVKLAAAPGYEICTTTREMRRVVQEGILGPVYIAHAYAMGFGHAQETIRSGKGALAEIDPSWYYRRGAGPLPDVAVYSFQLLTSILGPVRRVTAFANRRIPERSWQGKTIPVTVDDNNLVLMEFASGTIATAIGADCRQSERIPWGGVGLYGTTGVLEITGVHPASGYPTRFEIQSGTWGQTPPGDDSRAAYATRYEYATDISEQPYITGAHLGIEEPHVYADIMDLAESIVEDRPPRASGEQARHLVEIVEKANAAIATGQAQNMESTF